LLCKGHAKANWRFGLLPQNKKTVKNLKVENRKKTSKTSKKRGIKKKTKTVENR
jgi:hypothetical protein